MFVENWFHEDSGRALTRLYGTVVDRIGDIVEVGCWEGRSTVILAHACQPEIVHAVDTWEGSPSDVSGHLAKERDVYSAFLRNTAGMNIVPHRMGWVEYFATVRNPVKFCHIDGDHTYEQVRGNVEVVLPLLNGLLVGDDYHNEQVAQAVDDTLGLVGVAASLWYWPMP